MKRLLGALAIFSLFALPANSATSEKGWLIEQTSKIAGHRLAFVTATKIKLVNQESGIAVISKAPDWKVLVLNQRTKKYFVVDLPHMQGEQSQRAFYVHYIEMNKHPWIKGEQSITCGLPSTEYHFSKGWVRVNHRDLDDRFELAHMAHLAGAQAFCANSIPMLPSMSKFVATIYAVGQYPNFPLRVLFNDTADVEIITLSSKAPKQQMIAATEFQVPPDFKPVKNEVDVYSDARDSQLLDASLEFLGDPNKSSPPAKAKEKSNATTK